MDNCERVEVPGGGTRKEKKGTPRWVIAVPINNTDPTGKSIFGDVLTGLGVAAAVAAIPLTGGTSLAVGAAGIGLDLAGAAENGAGPTQLATVGILDTFSLGIGGLGDALAEGATSTYLFKGFYAVGAAATNYAIG